MFKARGAFSIAKRGFGAAAGHGHDDHHHDSHHGAHDDHHGEHHDDHHDDHHHHIEKADGDHKFLTPAANKKTGEDPEVSTTPNAVATVVGAQCHKSVRSKPKLPATCFPVDLESF